jgi:excisionase family DNA binding protein
MFDIQVRFLVGGKQVGLDGFVDALVSGIRAGVRDEVRRADQERSAVGGHPAPGLAEEGRKLARPFAVGVAEAAKLLGVSPYTIRNYIASGRLRSVRVGRRVLVPMDVLEKVIVEGVARTLR